MRLPTLPTLLTLFVVFLIPFLAGCGGDDSLKHGETTDVTVHKGDEPYWNITFTAMDTDPKVDAVETDGVPADFVEIPTAVSYAGSGEAPSELPTLVVTKSELESFMQAWDAYQGGLEDDGTNGKSFAEWLRERTIYLPKFLYQYANSGMDLSAYMAFFADMEAALGDMDQKVTGFLHFLDYADATMAIFQAALTESCMTPSSLWALMTSHNWDFNGLITAFGQAKLGDETTTLATFFTGLSNLPVSSPARQEGNVIAALKFAWSIISDNKPEAQGDGAYTYILNSEDTDPLHYVNSKEMSGTTHTWKSTYYGLFDVVRYKFHYGIRYGATNPNYTGHWVPSTYVEVTDILALWPNKLNGVASLEDLVNTGTYSNPNPQFKLKVTISLANILGARQFSYSAKLDGKSGIISDEAVK